jgi:hypothetical protein
MAYIIYERELWRSPLPAVSICVSGRIVLNAPAARLFNAHRVEWVLLLSDPEQRKIAVGALTNRRKKDKRAFRIDYQPRLSEAAVCAKSFLKRLGWDGRRYRLDAHWDEENSRLEFTMPDWGSAKRMILPVEVSRQKAG